MNNYNKLEVLWERYLEVVNEKPYDGDKIQGHGAAFAKEWNKQKENICKDFAINEGDFNYGVKHDVMARISGRH